MGPDLNMPIIAQSFLAFGLKPENKNEKFTFKELKKTLIEIKESPDYSNARKIVETRNKIINRESKAENWEADKVLLIEMGFDENQIDDIKGIAIRNQGVLYYDIFLIFSDTIEVRKERAATERLIREKKLLSDNPDLKEWVEGLYAYMDYNVGIKKSKELNKSALIYFNGYGCVNSREIEAQILTEIEIKNYINDKLIFINLLVDERIELADSERYYSKTLNKEIKYTGQKNFEFEKEVFNADSQPLFILLDAAGNEIARISYTNNIQEFKEFLMQ
jgi:hypothetical protein